MPDYDKIAFFGHHKCGSRFFRLSILGPLLKARGYDIISYRIENPPFHFRLTHELDLHNVDFDAFGEPGRKLLNLANSSQDVVGRVIAAVPDVVGVHVVRDPRQVLVSDYFHHREGHAVESPLGWVWDSLREDRPRLLELPLEEGLIYELDHITGDVLANQIAPWQPLPNVIELKLEDFSGVQGYDATHMTRLVEFLRIDRGPALNFGQTHKNPGTPEWREVFTPRLTDLFKQRWGQLLVRLGYEENLDW